MHSRSRISVFGAALVVFELIFIFLHTLIYLTIMAVFPVSSSSVLHTGIVTTLGFLSISFVAASLVAHWYNTFLIRIFYRIAAVWLGILLYVLMALSVVWVAMGLSMLGLSSFMPGPFFTLLLLGAALLVSFYGFYNARRIVVTSISVVLPNLPASWIGRKALWVSDIHLGHVRGAAFSKRIVAMLEKQKADVVFVGGDLYDGSAVDAVSVVIPFAGITAPFGTFFITGNHEEFSDPSSFLEAVRGAGMHVLANAMVDLDGLQIIGVDYHDTVYADAFNAVLNTVPRDRKKPSLLLKHEPSNLGVAEQQGIDLMICGHTHRAQVIPFRWLARRMYHGFEYGLKRFKNMQVYTSSGVGTWGPPLRVGTCSEIVEVTFTAAS